MNRLKLEIVHGFGSNCQQGLQDSVNLINFSDEQQRILYPIGKYFALKNVESTETNFIQLPENCLELFCIAVSPDKTHLALSHSISTESCPIISVYKIQNAFQLKEKQKTFRYNDNQTEKINIMTFSNNARFLACMTNQQQILYIDLNRMKVVGSSFIKNQVSRIQINPEETHLISLSGPNCFKILRVQEKTVKVMSEIKHLNQNQNFTDHKWAAKQKLLLCNDQGQLFIIVNYELVQIIQNGFNAQNVGIQCIETFSRGFLLGSKNGCFALWIKNEENDCGEAQNSYRLQRQFNSLTKNQIVSISISKIENLVAVAYNNNDICTFDLDNLLPSIQNDSKNHVINEVEFNFIYNGFHSGPISSMDICLQRPIIVTACKKDSSIRVWNYNQMRCDLAKKIQIKDNQYPLKCISIHPNGYLIAVGFVDKVRIFYLMQNELRIYREIQLENCCQISYSNGGNFLACAWPKQKDNKYDITIYQSHTLERLGILKGHTQDICELCFNKNDQFLYSCGSQGQIYEWSTLNWAKREFQTSYQFTSITKTKQKCLLACGINNDDAIINEIKIIDSEIDQKRLYNKIKRLIKTENLVKTLTYFETLANTQLIVCGTQDGQIQIYSDKLQSIIEKIPAHQGSVTHVKVSPDGRFIISSGEDGSVFVLSLKEMDQDDQPVTVVEDDENFNYREFIVDESLGDMLLVSRGQIDLQQLDVRMKKLEIRNIEEKLIVTRNNCHRQIDQLQLEAKNYVNKEVQSWSKQYEDAWEEKTRLENEIKEVLKRVENKQIQAVDELENLQEHRIYQEKQRTAKIEADILEQKIVYKDKISQLIQKNSQSVNFIYNQFYSQMKQVNRLIESTKLNSFKIRDDFEIRLCEQENDLETEIRQNTERLTDALKQQNIKFEEYQKSNESLKEENTACKTAKENSDFNQQVQQEDYKKTNELFQIANRKIEQLLSDLNERDNTIRLKDKKLFDFKNKVIELEKNKHVMAFRSSEMRTSLEPKEAQIEQLKIELFKLEGEFEQMLKASTIQNQKLIKQNVQVGVLEKNIQIQSELTKQKQNYYQKIIMDIHDTVKGKNVKEWPNAMTQFYKVYVQQLEIKQQEKDPESYEEHKRQMNHLEHSIEALYDSSLKKLKRREEDIHLKTMENAVLLSDLNELRIQNKFLQTKLIQLKNKMESQKQDIFLLKDQHQQEKIQNTQNQQTLQVQTFTNDSIQQLNRSQNLQGSQTIGSRHMISFDKNKFNDLLNEIEKAKDKIYYLERFLKKSQLAIQMHQHEKSCTVQINQDK